MIRMRTPPPLRRLRHLACWLQWGHPSIIGHDQHVHDWHECIYVIHGEYRVHTGPETWVGKTGDWFLFPPACAHTPRLDGVPSSRLYVAQWAADGLPLPDRPVRLHDGDRRLLLLFDWLAGQVVAGEARPSPLAQALWWTLVQALAAALAPTATPPPAGPVEQVLRVIRELPANPLALGEMAILVGLSRSQLVRRFHAEAGMTPMRALRQERLRRAARLLATTDLPLETIAREVGLSAAAHLSRLFKAEHGEAPAIFRTRTRKTVAGTGPKPMTRR